jgi:hypothetical protein
MPLSGGYVRPERYALREPDSNRGPTTVTDREARFLTFGQTQKVFAVWKPISHPTLGIGHEDDVIIGVGCEERDVREPNATIVTGSCFQRELKTSDGTHGANVALYVTRRKSHVSVRLTRCASRARAVAPEAVC